MKNLLKKHLKKKVKKSEVDFSSKLTEKGGVLNGLIVPRRLLRCSSPSYQAVGLKFGGKGSENIKAAVLLFGAVSSKVVTDDYDSITFDAKCKVAFKGETGKLPQDKNLTFSLNYYLSNFFQKAFELENDSYLGCSFGSTAYQFSTIFYFEHYGIGTFFSGGEKKLKEAIEKKLKKEYLGSDDDEEDKEGKELVEKAIELIELTMDNEKIGEIHNEMSYYNKRKACFNCNFPDVNKIMESEQKKEKKKSRQAVFKSDDDESREEEKQKKKIFVEAKRDEKKRMKIEDRKKEEKKKQKALKEEKKKAEARALRDAEEKRIREEEEREKEKEREEAERKAEEEREKGEMKKKAEEEMQAQQKKKEEEEKELERKKAEEEEKIDELESISQKSEKEESEEEGSASIKTKFSVISKKRRLSQKQKMKLKNKKKRAHEEEIYDSKQDEMSEEDEESSSAVRRKAVKILEKRSNYHHEDDKDENEGQNLEEMIDMASIDAPFDKIIKEYLEKKGIKKPKMDLNYYMLSLVRNKKMKIESKKMIDYLLKINVSLFPKDENIYLAKKFVKIRHKKYKDDKNYYKWWEYCNLIYTEMDKQSWFFLIKYWICRELFKTNKAKLDREHMNKALVISGNSGVGKTSFCNQLINPIFRIHNLVLGEYIYQSPSIMGEDIKVFVSPDDARIDEMYDFVQVLQGEITLQIKREQTPENTFFKSGIICTNLKKKDIFTKSGRGRADFKTRLKRRIIFCDLGSNELISLFCFATNRDGLNPPIDFRRYFFWTMMLKFRTNQQLITGDKTFRKKKIFDIDNINKIDHETYAVKKYQDALKGEKTLNQENMFRDVLEEDAAEKEKEKN